MKCYQEFIIKSKTKTAYNSIYYKRKTNECFDNILLWIIKNGIIIDGVLHEAVQYKINCKRCSLLSVCHEFNAVCAVIGCEAFVERGKVTVTSYYRETPKNAGEIIKNR